MRNPLAVGSHARALLAALVLAGLAPAVLAQNADGGSCGVLRNAYGPFDYRTQRDKLQIVEDFHLNTASENLIKPMGRNFGGDFDYTLRASPNHHRALIAMARYSERTKSDRLADMNWTVDCYFDRAMRFARDDMIVRMIYAGYLGHTNREAQALAQLDYVAQSAGDNPFTHYNLGLLYLELKHYDKALAQAHTAQQMGLPRTELREALKKAGKWVEAPAAAAPAEVASAAAPAS